MSRLIHKKWPPLEDIEARDLKFCVGPCITSAHVVQKDRLNLRTFRKIGPVQWSEIITLIVVYDCKCIGTYFYLKHNMIKFKHNH